jgi:hypothetical protein
MDRIQLRVTLNENDWDALLIEANQRALAQSSSGRQRLLRWLPSAFTFGLTGLTVLAYATSNYGRLALAALTAVSLFSFASTGA